MTARRLLSFSVSVCLIALQLGFSSAQQAIDWPREISAEGYELTLYQPQVDAWEAYSSLEGRMVVGLTRPGSDKADLGAISFSADTRTDMDTRTVFIHDLRINDVNFPTLNKARVAVARSLLERLLPNSLPDVPLDAVLANLTRTKASSRAIETDRTPPNIFVSRGPAVLVLLDGDPVLSPIEGTDLMYAANTDSFLFFDTGSSTYYLFTGSVWLKAAKLDGKWTEVKKLPRGFSMLPDKEEWRNVREHMKVTQEASAVIPLVFVSTSPAELILINGDPKFTPIKGTRLLHVTNSDADLFLCNRDGHYYYLTSGRWFRAKSLDGPWEIAGSSLPADFARIPESDKAAHVLVSVPETPQAKEALIQAQIPRRATIPRENVGVEVTYGDDPVFKPIKGTSLEYAANTSYDVIHSGDLYYLCYKGVWFVSESPQGPWEVCDSVPKEIYSIPPDSPLYHVTYVYVYDSTPEEVEVGYTGGYEGSYIGEEGTVVYGTGYPYLPYVGAGAVPHYFSHGYATYGAGVFYNPYTGVYAAHHSGSTAYAHWGESVIGAGGRYLHTGHVNTPARDVRAFESGRGAQGVVVQGPRHDTGAVQTAGGDLYVGRDGNIYKKTDDGWSKYNGKGQWSPIETPSPPKGSLSERAPGAVARDDADRPRSRLRDAVPGQRFRDRMPPRKEALSRARDQRHAPQERLNPGRNYVLDGLLHDSDSRRRGTIRADDFRAQLQQGLPLAGSRDLQRTLQQRSLGAQRTFRNRDIPGRSFRSGNLSPMGRPSLDRGGSLRGSPRGGGRRR